MDSEENFPGDNHQAKSKRRPLRSYYLIWSILIIAILLDIGMAYWLYQRQPEKLPDPKGVQTLAKPEAAPDFLLVDQDVKPFTPARLHGKWTILFFGYTHCPDFCPTTLTALNGALHRLEKQNPKLAADTQVVFVSVDPFRDSPPVLEKFVHHFNSQFIGATGPPSQILRLTQPLGASYEYADPKTNEPLGDVHQQPQQKYTVNHNSGMYVFDDKARIVAWILPPHTADRIASVYQFIRKRYE